MERRWVWREAEEALPPALLDAVTDVQRLGAPLLARLLWNRGVRDPDTAVAFLRPTLAQGLRSPLLLRDMEVAARRLADAVVGAERIAVWADYDVDGVSGAAQLVRCLGALGADPLLHVPHRSRDGYGLNPAGMRALHAAGTRVVVTADCGTANARELALARELGLDVIVCDHHTAPSVRPPAFALLNPLQPECTFPFKGLAGAGVVFYLLMGLRMELRARGHEGLPDLRDYLELVTLGTVTDLVPLREENRVLVTHGLRALGRTTTPGLRALMQSALVESPSARDIGFRLGPRLNACGRMADARAAVEMLTTSSAERAQALAAELEVHNAERRAREEAAVAEAVAMLGPADDWQQRAALVVAGEGWHAGVVGIVAARLAERYHRPAVVIALDGDLGRGSGRSAGGISLHDALGECADLLETFGGHRQAVGLTIGAGRVAELERRLGAAVARRATPADLVPRLAIDTEVSLAELTPDLATALATLEPHGPGNPEPQLLVRNVTVAGVRIVGDPGRPHLKLRLHRDSRSLGAIGFGLGHLGVHRGEHLDVVVTPRLSRWNGLERFELEMIDARPATALAGSQHHEMSMEFSVP